MQFILFEEGSKTHSVVWTVALRLHGSSLLLRLCSSVIKSLVNFFQQALLFEAGRCLEREGWGAQCFFSLQILTCSSLVNNILHIESCLYLFSSMLHLLLLCCAGSTQPFSSSPSSCWPTSCCSCWPWPRSSAGPPGPYSRPAAGSTRTTAPATCSRSPPSPST